MKKILIGTHNKGKFKEIAYLISKKYRKISPLTLKIPKPLIEINKSTLLERAINLLISHGVQEISINVHYFSDQIQSFINKKKFQVKITISKEEDLLFSVVEDSISNTTSVYLLS